MIPGSDRPRLFAFTLVELLVVIALVLIIFFIAIPTHPGRESHAWRAVCINNQKQVAIGLIMFASDHSDKFPWQAPQTRGGVMELSTAGDVLPTYQVLSNYAIAPQSLHCRTDRQRSARAEGDPLAPTNVSYFLGFDARLTSSAVNSILTGDRHIACADTPISAGLFYPQTNRSLTWTAELHAEKKKAAGGVMSFVDGRAEWVSQKSLVDVMARQNQPTNRFAFP